MLTQKYWRSGLAIANSQTPTQPLIHPSISRTQGQKTGRTGMRSLWAEIKTEKLLT